MQAAHLGRLAGITLVFTALNCLKPLHIDDTAYYYYAAQIAQNPPDPYGFNILWYQHPQPAVQILAPPVLPYWWAGGIRLFGMHAVLWKLWLVPFCALFILSLYALLHRFVPGAEMPLLIMLAFSPVFLPSLNLMLDIPALALGLTGFNVFMHGCRLNSTRWGWLAGLIVGLGMQTKYTGLLVPVIMLAYAIVFRRMRIWLPAALSAALVFFAWELLVSLKYGTSHFLFHLLLEPSERTALGGMIRALCLHLGGAYPVVGALGLAGLCRNRLPSWMWCPLILVGYVVAAIVPVSSATRVMVGLFTGYGWLCLGTLALLAVKVKASAGPEQPAGERRETVFLWCWLVLEIAGYFLLSPFPATRRIMGVAVVATLLLGRLVLHLHGSVRARVWISNCAATSVVLGTVFFVHDSCDAWAQKHAAEYAARLAAGRDDRASVWYVGHWGFQFYAELSGMKPVVPDVSTLNPGDWLVVVDSVARQRVQLENGSVVLIDAFVIDDHLPFNTAHCFYSTAIPLARKEGPRLSASIYRCRKGTVAATPL